VGVTEEGRASLGKQRQTVVDFETKTIHERPNYPPAPVGVAVQREGQPPQYLAWGHPTGNNCTKDGAKEILKDFWRTDKLLFHNAKFDIDVAQVHFGLPMPDSDDTLFVLFLHNPNAKTISLKPASEELLGMKPEEQDAVHQWLIEHHVVRPDTKDWGAHIAEAPADLVGSYAIGDVVRTKLLFDKIAPCIHEAGMAQAYAREIALLPILLENEREGMRVDVNKLEQDIDAYEGAIETVDNWLRKRLKAPGLNVDSNVQLVNALRSSGVVTQFPRTPKGNDSVRKDLLTPDMFSDKQVASALGYRNRAGTCLTMWMRSWLEMATKSGGRILTVWNQVRQSHNDIDRQGARTGRLSCSPPFMNIPKKWEGKDDGYLHPEHLEVPRLPLVRTYILPDKGDKIGHRDYSQQELRVLAHFEDGRLAETYRRDPRTDFHKMMMEIINEATHLDITREPAKIIDLALVYAMGLGKLAARLKVDVALAKRMRDAQRSGLPGLAVLERSLKVRASKGEPVRTWGGRLYHKEDPIVVNGVRKDLGYKLLNTLIQSSSADVTKEAILRYHAHPKKRGRFMLTVHDEINVSCSSLRELRVLKEAMESVELDVPMLTDAKVGPNLGELQKYED
jgi:DNA polymerase I-like protein with 3'-5' exonuclease and polymerase domains